MTTLNGTINSTVDILRVSADNGFKDNGFRFRIDDEILAFLGYDRHDAAAILRVKAGDLTYWHVARAQDGTAAATHTSGATLFAVAAAFATSSNLTPPDPFAEVVTATPTLAEVLAEGNDPEGTNIVAAGDATTDGAQLGLAAGPFGGAAALQAGNGVQSGAAKGGGNAILAGGSGWDGNAPTSGASIVANGGYDDGPSELAVTTLGSAGTSGQALVSDGNGNTVWGFPGAAELVITEDASGAAGTYSGSIEIPEGATITGMLVTGVRDFNDGLGGAVTVGDEDDATGYATTSLQVGGQGPGADPVTVDLLDSAFDANGIAGAYLVHEQNSYTNRLFSPKPILVSMTVDGMGLGPPFLGEVRILITYVLPTPLAATFEAAP